MDNFRYYYGIAKYILKEAETPAEEAPATDAPTGETPSPASDAPPAEEASASDTSPAEEAPATDSAPSASGEDDKAKLKNPIDKIDNNLLIKAGDKLALTKLTSQVDSLTIKLIERQKKIETIIDSISFLTNIDDTKPKKYSKEEDYKKINGLLALSEYDKISVSNLFADHNALKDNFKTIQSDLKEKKENKELIELQKIADKANKSKFSKNINILNEKIKKIKSTLNNLNQIFNLKDFDKFKESTKKELKLAQKNSLEFIKKLS